MNEPPDPGGNGTHPAAAAAATGDPVGGSRPGSRTEPFDVVDEWGRHSFPATDPPANW